MTGKGPSVEFTTRTEAKHDPFIYITSVYLATTHSGKY